MNHTYASSSFRTTLARVAMLGTAHFHVTRWFVMGDDDTFFVTKCLLRLLSKYDYNGYYYIRSVSESHLQNIVSSYNMAFRGGGFAMSYPLAKALEGMQDRCIDRFPGLVVSDEKAFKDMLYYLLLICTMDHLLRLLLCGEINGLSQYLDNV